MPIERINRERPWERFRVGSPSTRPNWVEPECQPFTEVSHVAHLEAAHRIVTDGRIRAGLITDESLLKEERIQVAWLSPNHWGPGFRYGSVRFEFDFAKLIEGHRFYWVESMAYGVPACRILITKDDYSGHPILIPYDPTAGDGPWRFDEANDTHYRNGNYCLEFMVERDLELADLKDLDFEKHHQYQCCIDPTTCPERGMQPTHASARFLARLVATGSRLPAVIQAREVSELWFVEPAILHIQREIQNHAGEEFSGVLTPAHPSSFPIAREILNSYARPQLRDDIRYLAQLFENEDALKECYSFLIKDLLRP